MLGEIEDFTRIHTGQNTSAFRAGCSTPPPRARNFLTTRDGVTLQFVRGDIAAPEDIEAVVDAAHAQLVPGGEAAPSRRA